MFRNRAIRTSGIRECTQDISGSEYTGNVITLNKKLAEFVTEFGAAKEKTSVIGAGIDRARFNPELDGHEIREVYGLKKRVLFNIVWVNPKVTPICPPPDKSSYFCISPS